MTSTTDASERSRSQRRRLVILLVLNVAMIAGLVLVGWIAGQLLVLRRYFFLQPLLGMAGALVVVLAWLAHSRRGRR